MSSSNIRTANAEDATAVAEVATAARRTNALENALHPGCLSDAQQAERTKSYAADIAAPDSTALVCLETSSSRIVGFIHWQEVLDGSITAEMREAFIGGWKDLTALKQLAAANWQVYAERMKGRPHFCE